MRIIIGGAGRVGTELARALRAEEMDVVLVDNDSRAVKNAQNLDVLVIHGDHDSLLPSPCGEDIVKNVQLAQWLLVDGMGHDLGPGIEAVITPAVCAFMGLGAVR